MLELVLRLGISLSVVLGLFWLVARTGSRRFGGPRQLMRVHGRQSLSRTASVAVVEVGSRVLVVGVSDGGVRLLTELDPEEIAVPETDPALAEQQTGAPGSRLAGVLRLPPRPRANATTAPATTAPVTVAPVTVATTSATAGPDGTALGGSLLSAQTWRQAWAAATSRSAGLTATAPTADGTVHD